MKQLWAAFNIGPYILFHGLGRTVRVRPVLVAGFIGCKMLAKWPDRVASLTMISTTQCGWHMAAQMMKRPWVTLKVYPF